MKEKIKLTYMLLLAGITWFAVILQFYISIVHNLTNGHSVAWSMQHILSYFTIQNNILVALALTVLLLAPASKWGKFFSKKSTLTAIALYITIVCLIYQVILRPLHTPVGLFKLADELLHTVNPPAYVLFWLIFVPKANIPWSQAFNWLIYPLAYLIYILIRGPFSGTYPYGFIDANKISYLQISINVVILTLVFFVLGLLFIAIDRLIKK